MNTFNPPSIRHNRTSVHVVLFLKNLLFVVSCFCCVGCWASGGKIPDLTDTDLECLSGDYYIAVESDVEQLQLYPCLEGSLSIVESNIVGIELPKLQYIEGGLFVYGNEDLAALRMDAIKYVDGTLSIQNNPSLSNVSLQSLLVIGNDLHVNSNDALPTLSGIRSVTSIDGDVLIDNNYQLGDLGLNDLSSVGGENIDIFWNPLLPQCLACELLEQISDFSGNFYFYNNGPDECSDTCSVSVQPESGGKPPASPSLPEC